MGKAVFYFNGPYIYYIIFISSCYINWPTKFDDKANFPMKKRYLSKAGTGSGHRSGASACAIFDINSMQLRQNL